MQSHRVRASGERGVQIVLTDRVDSSHIDFPFANPHSHRTRSRFNLYSSTPIPRRNDSFESSFPFPLRKRRQKADQPKAARIPLFLFFINTTRNSRIRMPPNSKNVCFINFGPRQNTLITASASFSLCFCAFVLTSFYPSFRSSRLVRLFLLSR